MTIDTGGIVRCSDQKAFQCLSMNCYCEKLEDLLVDIKSDTEVNIKDKATFSSIIVLKHYDNISIVGHDNFTVICINDNQLTVVNCNNLKIEGITWIGCGVTNRYIEIRPAIIIRDSFNVAIKNCTFKYSLAPAVVFSGVSRNVSIDHCNFLNNSNYRDHGTAIQFSAIHEFVLIINNCYFSYNEGAYSVIYIRQSNNQLFSDIYLNNSSFHNNQGVSVYLSNHINANINGEVVFDSNEGENGAGIYISGQSTVTFRNSNVKFIKNFVNNKGSAIFLHKHSKVIFDQNSLVTFSDNKATNGTIYSTGSSDVTFKANSQVTFSGNSATQHGSALYSSDNSHVTCTENSKVVFNNNVVSSNDINLQFGGTIFAENQGYISFQGNSTAMFNNNSADFGAAILAIFNSSVTFINWSEVVFNNNIAQYCGILTSAFFSSIHFNDNTKAMYNSNTMPCTSTTPFEYSAGAICTFHKITIIFSGHSSVEFINNKADTSGAMGFSDSNVIIEEHSKVNFDNNVALHSSGGALVCSGSSNLTIKDNSSVMFNQNMASQSGGAIHSYNMCKIVFKDKSTTTFSDNTARIDGGALLSSNCSEITFEGNSMVAFDGNIADNGGTFYFTVFTNSTLTFKETSMVSICNNKARQSGGVGYFSLNSTIIFEGATMIQLDNNIAEQNTGVLYSTRSKVIFKGNSTVALHYNKATLNGGALQFDDMSDVTFSEFANITLRHNRAFYGGAILANNHSNITVTGKSVLLFVSNEATQSGGAGYFNHGSNFIIKDEAMVTFDNNRALHGGAVCIEDKTKVTFTENSTTLFYSNLATVNGGALKVLNESSITLKDHIIISFTKNNAQYGGAVFLDTTAVMANETIGIGINFTNNIAKISGNVVHQDLTQFCNSSCLNRRIIDIGFEFIDTPPNELQFYDPAVCIDNDDTECNTYYVQNIMLGAEIVIPAHVFNYYNQCVNSTQFLVQSEMHPNYYTSDTGPQQILLGCDKFEGIRIMGNQSVSKATNFSINISLNIDHTANWRQISVKLVVELSPCHLGFWQYPTSKECECYNASDIVFCSGSSSTIKRGYWFGSVTGKPTVTLCPINYCNFTCCETSDGYYHLSPVRDDQCRLHRSGTACGNCIDGYTLSFDSTECVNVRSCTAGQTTLVILLTVTYWIVIVTLVFAMMYYKVGIGYLYGITYYYSIVDIVLSQNLYTSRVLYFTVNIMSSFSKIIPQFLGELCLTTGMSGIDQQLIHYIHPSAVILILGIISLLARTSRRVSAVISRGIIHVICLLLLLSYTSIASTSLLLMRPLTFHDINKVYTYLSPDIEYFHGRHLAYGIVALLCTFFIAIGLPFLLTLEPLLNHKINFIKVKPLLDQFQGCYKDKYRCFAGYYMICRLVIITIVIADSSDEFVTGFMLVVACGIIALIHLLVKPYSHEVLNKLDGIVLQLIIFTTVLPLFGDFDSPLVITITFLLVILPLLNFISTMAFINRDVFQKVIKHFTFKDRSLASSSDVSNNEMSEYNLIVGNTMRGCVTTCDM